MADLEKMEKQLEQLQNRIRAEKQKRSEKERKARNHAMMVLGGMVAKRLDNDWKSLDFEKLDAWLEKYAYKIQECTCDELSLTEAKERLRNWERGNAWGSYGKEPGEAEATTAAMEDGSQGLEEAYGYPQAQPNSMGTHPDAASSAARNLAQDASASGGDYGA